MMHHSDAASALLPIVDRVCAEMRRSPDPALRHSLRMQALGVIQAMKALGIPAYQVRMAELEVDHSEQAARKANTRDEEDSE